MSIDGKPVECSDEFSMKDFTGRRDIDIPDAVNVFGSCFSQEEPDVRVFRGSMQGVRFYNCNLDNVRLPIGNSVIGSSRRRFKVQNDLNDWLIDEQDRPTLPIDHKYFTKFKLEMPKPEEIPLQKVEERVDLRGEAVSIEVAAEPMEHK